MGLLGACLNPCLVRGCQALARGGAFHTSRERQGGGSARRRSTPTPFSRSRSVSACSPCFVPTKHLYPVVRPPCSSAPIPADIVEGDAMVRSFNAFRTQVRRVAGTTFSNRGSSDRSPVLHLPTAQQIPRVVTHTRVPCLRVTNRSQAKLPVDEISEAHAELQPANGYPNGAEGVRRPILAESGGD
jgi:hypothetical protein